MKAYQEVQAARHGLRPNASYYIAGLLTDFHECHGDRLGNDDPAIIGGIGYLEEWPVTIIGHRRGRNLEENQERRFGMPMPSGYRKAMRLMRQAEKFSRPVITLIDTPGAYPGVEAEAQGQAIAIAECIATMASLEVATIALVIGEGGSGGALALAVADRLLMLEHSVFSVISPEAAASILWKDAGEAERAAESLALTAGHLKDFGLCDDVLNEPNRLSEDPCADLRRRLSEELTILNKRKDKERLNKRYERYRKVGESHVSGGGRRR